MHRAERFRYSTSIIKGTQTWALMALVLVPVTLALGLVVIELLECSGSWAEIGKAAAEDASFGWQLMIAAVAGVTGIAHLLYVRQAYLDFDFAGIDYYLPRFSGLGLLGVTTGKVRVPWEAVRAVRLLPAAGRGNPAQRLPRSLLEIETPDSVLRFAPFNFVKPGGPDHRLSFREAARPKHFDIERILRRAPAVEALEARGYRVTTDGEAANAAPVQRGFDLSSHKGMLVQLALLVIAAGYAVVEFVLLSEYQRLGPEPWPAYAAIGILSAAACAVLGRGAPILERASVAVLVTAAALAATQPAVMRFDLQRAEPQPVSYAAVAPGEFEAAGYPDIDVAGGNLAEYWAQYPAGANYTFHLSPATGDSYVLHLSHVYERTRAFYEQLSTEQRQAR